MKPLCWAPWSSLTVRSDGEIYPCCVYSDSLGTFQQTADLISALNSKKLAALKAQLISGEQPAGCSTCFQAERRGSVSKRQKIIAHAEKERFSSLLPEQGKLSHLEISFSNLCNLTCVMCSSTFSSSWVAHEEERTRVIGEVGSAQRRVIRLPEDEMERLAEFASDIDSLQVLGGEPTFDNRCGSFLRKLAEINPYCDVNITTNGTLMGEEFLKTLRLFRKGSINLSIDGVGRVYEYIRGAPFAQVADMALRLESMNRDFLISVNPAMSVFNALNLPDLIAWTNRLAEDLPHLQIEMSFNQFVVHPRYLSSRLMPKPLLRKLATELKEMKARYPTLRMNGISAYIDYISTATAPDAPLEAQLRRATTFFNQLRRFPIWEAEPRLDFLRSQP